MIDDQQRFFQQLREQVGALIQAKKSASEIHGAVPRIREELTAQARIRRYVGDGLSAQAEKVYNEMTGQKFPDNKVARAARQIHRHSHSLLSV